MKTLHTFPTLELNDDLKLKGFRVYEAALCQTGHSMFGRRHFYKIVLSTGKTIITYTDRSSVELDGVCLYFANPHIPYSVDILSGEPGGYACIFTENFIKPLERSEILLQSPLFKADGNPAFRLTEQQRVKITGIFESMIAEQATNYVYKADLLRNYIQLIVHEALRMQPEDFSIHYRNASTRITNQFLDLLERQFPIESITSPLMLKTAQDYANQLAVHVNYLNRAVKEETGKSTTTHIADRVTTEATVLLQHTDWSVAEIAYALGFEYPNYFSNFFKKMTGNIPKAYRSRQV
ncbi:AraC family transcriptional regulator [Cytophagaceae bacterium DM2B3-1]|uniref:AraC family transcriptional regulator n=1 Tax=Xanthocytophaga flava TaxID=3048013 RepID=A0ABT7CVQ5_9BACT|nr:AraC family transcriptional regulator [Xanthocytophaga flavus]MDJ1497850.1 AraC family transcriptional regulator [Xanthocytophaga flavus]